MIRFLYLPAIDDGGSHRGKFFLIQSQKLIANSFIATGRGKRKTDG